MGRPESKCGAVTVKASRIKRIKKKTFKQDLTNAERSARTKNLKFNTPGFKRSERNVSDLLCLSQRINNSEKKPIINCVPTYRSARKLVFNDDDDDLADRVNGRGSLKPDIMALCNNLKNDPEVRECPKHPMGCLPMSQFIFEQLGCVDSRSFASKNVYVHITPIVFQKMVKEQFKINDVSGRKKKGFKRDTFHIKCPDMNQLFGEENCRANLRSGATAFLSGRTRFTYSNKSQNLSISFSSIVVNALGIS